MENRLILTIGLPYSGKSRWARGFESTPIVNPDSIRLATHGQRFVDKAEALIWAMAKIMARSLFLAGHDTVIVDATHTHAKRRDFWKDSDWKRYYIVMDVAPEVCFARAREANDIEIFPIIERMAENIELDGVYYGTTGIERIPMISKIERPGPESPQIYHKGQAFD